MRPPICDICGTDFRSNPDSGSLITFKKKEGQKDLQMPGHPGNAEWYCILHQEAAKSLSALTVSEATPLIRKKSFFRFLTLFVGTSIVTGAMALGGMLVGGIVANTPGLFIGTLAGGVAGVISCGLVAAAADFLPRPVVPASITGGIIGFLMAAALAIGGSNSFDSAFIPAVGSLLIGAGFLLGRRYAARRLAGSDE